MRKRFLSVMFICLLLVGGSGLAFAQGDPALAQKYRNAKPGESFLIGHITFHLGQEYAIMVYQSIEQACKQMGLKFKGAVANTQADWIELTESMIASGAKAIIYNCPNAEVMPKIAEIANKNNVFIASYFGYTGDIWPGAYGPRWVLDNTPLSDEQTFIPLTLLMEKMEQAKKSKIYIQQGSKSAATVSTVLINLGVFQALLNYPTMQLMGFQYGEWGYEGGRSGAEAALAVRTDYEGFWSANDSMATGGLKALRDRGVEIGAFTASRDMEMTTAQDILKGRFLVTSGFAIPYYGGRLVPMLYDMCVGAWYPTPEEMLQTGKLTVYGRPGELEKLAEAAGIAKHGSFKTGPLEENLKQILMQMKEKNPSYPYDFRLMSLSKTKELGLKYDRTAGAGDILGAHDYYFIPKLKKFGSIDAWKKHVAALYSFFLDISWMTDQQAAKEMAKKFPKELKYEAVWE